MWLSAKNRSSGKLFYKLEESIGELLDYGH